METVIQALEKWGGRRTANLLCLRLITVLCRMPPMSSPLKFAKECSLDYSQP